MNRDLPKGWGIISNTGTKSESNPERKLFEQLVNVIKSKYQTIAPEGEKELGREEVEKFANSFLEYIKEVQSQQDVTLSPHGWADTYMKMFGDGPYLEIKALAIKILKERK